LENTVSDGLISAIRDDNGTKLLQISAPISHGSSGGAMFNSNGEVIGITSAGYEDGQNLNFAVAINHAKQEMLK
jgi:S1-C subfamily serine protease